jgi:hypothetical protein
MVLNLVFSSKRKSTVLGESGKRCIKKQVASNKQQKIPYSSRHNREMRGVGGGGIPVKFNSFYFDLLYYVWFDNIAD